VTLLLIDGNALVYRAFYASGDDPGLRSDGLPTGAVSGFCSRLWDCTRDRMRGHRITHAAVIFDHPGKNWRHKVSETYKANRTASPDDLTCQLQIARHLVPHFGMRGIEQRGYEADDLIATFVRLNEESGGETIIATGDKDLYQLIRPGVSIYDPMKDQWINEEDVLAKFGVPPRLVADVQGLAGDTVDNVPGVPGVGLKTAAELVSKFGSLDLVLENADLVRQPKRRAALMEFADQARLSRQLVALDDDVPLRVGLGDLEVYPPDAPALLSALATLEIIGFARRVAWAFNLRADEAAPCPAMAAFADEMMMWRAI
jgi:DNA polymerase I